jgi:hypothetical protein
MFAGAEGVAELAEVDELGGLAFADDELGAAFDFLVLIGKAPGDGVARIVLPLDDFQKLRFKIIHQAHNVPFVFCGLNLWTESSENCGGGKV